MTKSVIGRQKNRPGGVGSHLLLTNRGLILLDQIPLVLG